MKKIIVILAILHVCLFVKAQIVECDSSTVTFYNDNVEKFIFDKNKTKVYMNKIDGIKIGNVTYGIGGDVTIGTTSSLGCLPMPIPSDFDYAQIVVYGQSLAQGGAAQGAVSVNAIENNYMLSPRTGTGYARDWSSSVLVPLKYADNNDDEAPVVGFVNAYSSLYRRYYNKNQKFVATNGGYSGAQIELIGKGSSYYSNFIAACSRLNEIAQGENKKAGCIAILFMQGESNYSPNSGTADETKSGYKKLVLQLKEDLQNDLSAIYGQDVKPVFLMYETGYQWIRNNHWDLTISQAQLELSQEVDDIILVNPTYQLTINTSRHPNYNGYRWYGEQAAKALWQATKNGLRYETVRPISVKLVNSNTINVAVYAPVYPIVIDTHTNNPITNYGFDVRLNGSTCTINSVTTDGTSINITTNEDLSSGIVEVTYAGLNRQGQGNICDSDRWLSLTEYVDDTDESPHNRRTYQYPVVKRPLDKDGNLLFGKPYPMQNWLTNFYANLNIYFSKNLVCGNVGDDVCNSLALVDGATVVISSSDASVATYSENVVHCLSVGTCVITATVTYSDKVYVLDFLTIVKQ